MTKTTRKRVIWCFVIAGVLLFSGAVAATVLHIHRTNDYSTQSDGIVWGSITEFSSDKGFYHCKMISEDNKFYFFDYASKQNVPVCNRPNCTHTDSSSCDAFFPQGVNIIALYKNKLYAAGSTDYNHTTVWQMNADGSDKKKIATLSTNNVRPVAFMNGKAYYPTMEMELENNQPTKKMKAGIHALDLKTGRDSVIVPERKGYEANINFFGAEKDKLFYVYNYYKEKPDPTKVYSGMENFNKSGIVESLYEFDLRTGKENKIPLDVSNVFSLGYSGGVVYYETIDLKTNHKSLNAYVIATRKSMVIYSGDDLIISLVCKDGMVYYKLAAAPYSKVAYPDTEYNCFYNIKTKKTIKLSAKLSNGKRWGYECAASNNGCVIWVGDKSNQRYAYILKTDLLTGKMNYQTFD